MPAGSGWLRRNVPDLVPVILLGMLAVDERYQGQGLGGLLLREAVIRAVSASEVIGTKALVVEPIDERARRFYEHYGFTAVLGTGKLFVRLSSEGGLMGLC